MLGRLKFRGKLQVMVSTPCSSGILLVLHKYFLRMHKLVRRLETFQAKLFGDRKI